MGTRFPVEGDAVRLFLQWGKGLHAQHLTLVEDIHDADEAYTYEWALNPADVTTLLPNPNS